MYAVFWTISVTDGRDAVTGTRTLRDHSLPCYQTAGLAHHKAAALDSQHGDGDLWFSVRRLVAGRWVEDHAPEGALTNWAESPF
jgi:hypothetical protein